MECDVFAVFPDRRSDRAEADTVSIFPSERKNIPAETGDQYPARQACRHLDLVSELVKINDNARPRRG